MSLNNNLIKNVENYLTLDKAEYAILLTGEWGSGKSYFVRNYFNNKDFKIIYVSLYGKGTLKDIQDDIYAQLHPLLSHKYFKFGGNLAKGLLKGTLKIDLNRDGSDDGTINYQIPDLNLKDQKIDLKKSILIFDDLERSSIDLDKVLGFINAFIEHDGIKTLIISNENEIDDDKYNKIKEKTIGKTFKIEVDIENSIRCFIGDVGFVEDHDLILDIVCNYFKKGDYKNLRILKYIIRELISLLDCVDVKFKSNKKFLRRILDIFVSLSIESKVGNIKEKEIKNVFDIGLDSYLKEKNSEKLNNDEIRIKNVRARLNGRDNTILGFDLWEEIIFKHTYNKKIVNEQISSSSYFFMDTAPLWQKMMNMRYMDENQILGYCDSIIMDLIKGTEKNLDIVMHYCGILLEIVKEKLVDDSKINNDMIVVYFNCYVESYLKNLTKDNYKFKDIFFSLNEFDHYGGYGFYNKDSLFFKVCREELIKLKNDLLEKVKFFEVQFVLEMVENDWDGFNEKFKMHEYAQESYGFANIEIFYLIDVEMFSSKMINMSNYQLDDLRFLWKDRYRSRLNKYEREKVWFDEIKNKLIEKSENLDKVKKFNIRRLVEVFD